MERSCQWILHLRSPNLPMERFTLGAWGSPGPFTKRFTPCSQLAMEFSLPWKVLLVRDLPMETSTLDVSGSSEPYITQRGSAQCTNSVYKAARTSLGNSSANHLAQASPRQVSSCTYFRYRKTRKFTNYPRANCQYLRSFTKPNMRQQRMTLSGFARSSLNKQIHSLNGNFVSFDIQTPRFRSKLWEHSFHIR